MSLTTQNSNQLSQWTAEDERLVMDTICKGCSPADYKLFKAICQRTQLCPFAKQIYAVPRWDAKLGRNSMTVQTSIDGFRLVAERTGKYAPGRATEYAFDMHNKLISATSFVKKQTSDGTWHEVSHTAFYEEYCQKTKDGSPTKFWKDMPRVMLAKVAEAACLRKCFPMELSQIYTKEEMDQSEIVETIDHEEIKPKPPFKSQETSIPLSNPMPFDQKIDMDQLNDLLIKHSGTEVVFQANMKKHLQETWKINDFSEINQSQYPLVMRWIQLNLEKIKKEPDNTKAVA
jgi:phage recombination protein Bet